MQHGTLARDDGLTEQGVAHSSGDQVQGVQLRGGLGEVLFDDTPSRLALGG